jgi:signal peptidase I
LRRTVVEWIVTLAVAAVVVLAVEHWLAQPFRVPTGSMEPTLQCAKPSRDCTGRFNDRVIVAKIVYRFRDPRRFEIAVFHAPPAAKEKCAEGGTFLKRVIGLPGEQVSEKDGIFYVDGKKLTEPYETFDTRDSVTQHWSRDGPNQYFVMGDYRIDSCDSRTWGTVARSAFIGPVVATYWPPNRWTIR